MNLKKDKILVLYAEVMPYNVVCFKNFVQTTNGEIRVICWGKEKKLTPYEPPAINNISYYIQYEFKVDKIKKLIDSYQPDIVYVVGRMEQDYLAACLYARGKGIPVIGTSDNQFSGNWKQKVSKLFSRYLWQRYFTYMMVPGLYQYEYMRYLGFKREQILFPQYCADTDLFNHYYYENKNAIPKKKQYILFVGRLDTVKGLDILMDAFVELKNESYIDLNLMIIGNGPLANTIPKRSDIIHHSFLEQENIIKLLPEVAFFCLPSRREPWGLVIHELAAAGIPIIATTICGASAAFVKNGYNGILIKTCDKQLLKNAIVQMHNLSVAELSLYGERSFHLSTQITPALWTATIKSILD